MNPTPEQLQAMLQPTKLDQLCAAISPKWGADRVRQRRAFAYEAACNTRLRNSATTLAGPEGYRAFPDRIELIKQVRDLEQNFGLFQSIIDKLAMYAFGRLRYQAHTGDKKVNDQYEAYLEDECFPALDITGRHNLRTLTGLTFKSQLRDGDFALKWVRRPTGLKLVGIESDRIGGNTQISGQDNVFQGIVTNPDSGEPLAYQVYRRGKAGSYTDMVPVSASDIIFYFDPRRVDQYRGITPFAPIINEARDWKEMMEACRIGTKFENYHAAIGYTESGQPISSPADYINGTDLVNGTTHIKEQEIKPGLIQWAPKDSKIEMIKSERPSGQFQTYAENLIRLMGVALNLPMGFLYNLAGLTGPSARMDSQQAQRVIQWHQQNMKERVLHRVATTYLMDGIAQGKIPYTPDWHRGDWQFPPWLTIDVGRETTSSINAWRSGLLSKADWFAENGQDAEEQDAIISNEIEGSIIKAKELSEKHKVPLEFVLTMVDLRTPNGFLFTSNTDGQGQVAEEKIEEPRKKIEAARGREAKLKELVAQIPERQKQLSSGTDLWNRN